VFSSFWAAAQWGFYWWNVAPRFEAIVLRDERLSIFWASMRKTKIDEQVLTIAELSISSVFLYGTKELGVLGILDSILKIQLTVKRQQICKKMFSAIILRISRHIIYESNKGCYRLYIYSYKFSYNNNEKVQFESKQYL
jgi:hypothetical protein